MSRVPAHAESTDAIVAGATPRSVGHGRGSRGTIGCGTGTSSITYTPFPLVVAAREATGTGIVRARRGAALSTTLDPIVDAVVFLNCRCLSAERVTQSDAQGWYTFDGLPAGVYTVDVMYDQSWSAKVVELLPNPRPWAPAPRD